MVRTISVRVLAEVEPGRVATRGARAESDFLRAAGADDVQLRVAQLRLAQPRMVKEQDETATSPPDAAETESSGEGEVGGAAPSLHPFNDQVRPPSGYRQSRRRPAPSRASAPPGRDGCRRGQSTSGRTGQQPPSSTQQSPNGRQQNANLERPLRELVARLVLHYLRFVRAVPREQA